MKYRILEKGGRFYPQSKLLFWWFNYEDYYARTVFFLDLERAKKFFDDPPKKEEVIHQYP